MRKLLALALIAAASALGANFTYVQITPASMTGTATNSQTFASNNTAGNIIVVFVYNPLSTLPAITDTLGNTYTLFALQVFDAIAVYAAVNIRAGANTVATTGSQGLVAMEYSSANPTYYVCSGSSDTLSNSGAGYQGIGSVLFNSPSEVMAVFGGDITFGPGGTWILGSGNLRFSGGNVAGFGGNASFTGDEDLASLTGTYTNSATFPRWAHWRNSYNHVP